MFILEFIDDKLHRVRLCYTEYYQLQVFTFIKERDDFCYSGVINVGAEKKKYAEVR